MKRARLTRHDRAVGSLLFVVVFLAAASIGSPHNNDRTSGLQRRSVYSHRILMPGHRTITENKENTNVIDEDSAKEQEEVLEAEAVEEKSHELNEVPLETDYEMPASRENNSTDSCFEDLLKKHPGICDVVDEIFDFYGLLGQLRQVAMKRMGGRRFNFGYLMEKGKTVMEQLYEAVRSAGAGIQKFLKFSGIIGSAETTSLALPKTRMIDNPEPERNQSRDRRKESDEQLSHQVDHSLIAASFDPSDNDDEEQTTGGEAFKYCAARIIQVDSDVCGALAKIELLDSILKNFDNLIRQRKLQQQYKLTIELESNNLGSFGLGSFLEAVRESLFNARTAIDVKAIEEAWRYLNTGAKSSTRRSSERRHTANENDDEVAEIFQTSDFRIEFLPQNDHPIFRDSPASWNANNFMDNGDRESEARQMPRVKHRSAGFNDKKAKQRDKIVTRRPDETPRRAHENLGKKNVIAEQNKALSRSTHSSRRLRKNPISRNTDRDQREIQHRLQNGRRRWQSPYLPGTITPMKKYSRYKVGDMEDSDESKNKKKCVTDNEEKNVDWLEWLLSKGREVSKK